MNRSGEASGGRKRPAQHAGSRSESSAAARLTSGRAALLRGRWREECRWRMARSRRSASLPRRQDGGSPCGRNKLRPSREWLHIGLVLGLCIAVLPCAPCARTQVGELPSNWTSASTKAAGHGSGGRKVCENRRAFSHCPVLGARLVRALQNCCALSRWQGDYFAIRCRDGGGQRSRRSATLPCEGGGAVATSCDPPVLAGRWLPQSRGRQDGGSSCG